MVKSYCRVFRSKHWVIGTSCSRASVECSIVDLDNMEYFMHDIESNSNFLQIRNLLLPYYDIILSFFVIIKDYIHDRIHFSMSVKMFPFQWKDIYLRLLLG